MKNIAITFVLSVFAISIASAQSFSVLTSEVSWKGKAAFNAYSLAGTVALEEALFEGNKEALTDARILIDMRSIQSENTQLVKHLKSKDFFEVKRFQQAQFVMNSRLPLEAGKHEVGGQLEIKGKSHPIVFSMELTEAGPNWIMKGKLIIDRTRYGITFNSPSYFEKLKEQAIADEFELTFRLELTTSQQAMR